MSLQQIFRDHWGSYLSVYGDLVRKTEKENVEKIMSCKDPDQMGFGFYQCPNHPDEVRIIPHTCKSRFCNSCGKVMTDNWLCKCHERLPNISYYHLTLTIPQELRGLFKTVRPLLDVLFTTARDLLYSFFYDEKKVTPIIMEILHTFGRDLKWNPHLHIIISAGGLATHTVKHHKVYEGWKQIPFVPYKMLRDRWKV